MPLQSSGQIGAGDIRTEFNQTGELSFSDYYRGGSLVNADQTSVPTSGEISFSDFYGVDESVTLGPLYDALNYYFYSEEVDVSTYQVTVKWDGATVFSGTQSDPTKVQLLDALYERGSLQTTDTYSVSKTTT
jgi:hypothetical protein